MPTLADIYSAIDSAKRRAGDFLSNPGTSLEQMLGYAKKYGIELKYFDYTGIDVKDVGDMMPTEIVRGIENARDRVWGKAAYGA